LTIRADGLGFRCWRRGASAGVFGEAGRDAVRLSRPQTLLARASPKRSGDALAGVAAESAAERVAAQSALADLPLKVFLSEAIVPYEDDDVTRLIVDGVDCDALAPVASLTVGELRDWLLSDAATGAALAALSPGLTPRWSPPSRSSAATRT